MALLLLLLLPLHGAAAAAGAAATAVGKSHAGPSDRPSSPQRRWLLLRSGSPGLEPQVEVNRASKEVAQQLVHAHEARARVVAVAIGALQRLHLGSVNGALERR